MKDITITASALRRELYILLALLILALLTNLYAIVSYDGQWSEFFSQLHIILLMTVIYYVVLGIIRLIVHGVRLLVNRKGSAVNSE